MKKKCFILLGLLLLLVGCSAQQASPSYDETKKMMTDALQTEDGKKAIRQMFSDPEFKELLILEQPEVKKSIEDTLLSKEGEVFWKTSFDDPKFTEKIAKSMKEQQQDIMKELMKDSSFQKELETFFSQPEMLKQMETVMKSPDMKGYMEKVVTETIDSPLLQMKWQKLILASEKSKEEEKEKKKDEKAKDSGGGK